MLELKKRSFGKTNMQVSMLGLGCNQLGHVTEREARQLINRALDIGVNVIDTAECYRDSEMMLGRILGQRRRECHLFTKCGHASKPGWPDWHTRVLEQNIEHSLRLLKTDYLDMVQLHSCSYQQLQHGEVIEVLQRARQAGKILHIGYSGDRRAARYAVECGAFDSLQISVNIADQEALDEVLPLASLKGMGVIVKRPLANTAWKQDTRSLAKVHEQRMYRQRLKTLDYDFLKQDMHTSVSTALRFTVSIPEVDIILMGTTNPERLQQNMAYIEAGPLPPDAYTDIRQRWKDVTW